MNAIWRVTAVYAVMAAQAADTGCTMSASDIHMLINGDQIANYRRDTVARASGAAWPRGWTCVRARLALLWHDKPHRVTMTLDGKVSGLRCWPPISGSRTTRARNDCVVLHIGTCQVENAIGCTGAHAWGFPARATTASAAHHSRPGSTCAHGGQDMREGAQN
eukprot:jgi/Ulvmu1/1561/UM110_0024.1